MKAFKDTYDIKRCIWTIFGPYVYTKFYNNVTAFPWVIDEGQPDTPNARFAAFCEGMRMGDENEEYFVPFIHEMFDSAFDWAHTPEGREYWRYFALRWKHNICAAADKDSTWEEAWNKWNEKAV